MVEGLNCSICHIDPVLPCLLAYLFLKKGQEGLMTHPMYFVEKSNMIVETGCGTENETLWMLITTNSYTYSPK